MTMKLIIGNKAYSSWSLRGWLAMKQSGLPFEELVVPLYGAEWDQTRQVLWALGDRELQEIKIDGTKMVVEKAFPLPSRGGHDLVLGRDAAVLYLTTGTQVLVFTPKDSNFAIQRASECGHAAVVQLLLRHQRAEMHIRKTIADSDFLRLCRQSLDDLFINRALDEQA